MGYAADNVRQKFTGYEKDTESELDFAQARYYNSKHGRFTSVDPLLASGMVFNPKTWNRYAYALNNPLKFIDPTGLSPSTHTDADGKVIAVYDDNDFGVYVHQNLKQEKWDGESVLSKKGKGTARIGETYFWDDFRDHDKDGNINPGIAPGAQIVVNGSLDFTKTLDELNQKARKLGLGEVMNKSKLGGDFDIKNNKDIAIYGVNTGGLLGGKFVTARSAGNFLAGMNAATVPYPTLFITDYLSFDSYMKVAGEYNQTNTMSRATAASLVGGFTNPTVNVSPFYGESHFSGIYIMSGYNYGAAKR